MDPTLNDLEKRLDPARFFRISRAALINLNAVTEVFPLPGGSGEVALKNGAASGSQPPPLSRTPGGAGITLEVMKETALVTGGGRGLGRAIAIALGQSGRRVAVASRTAAELDETLALLRAAGCEGAAIPDRCHR